MVMCSNDGDARSAKKNRIRHSAIHDEPASVHSGWRDSDRRRLGSILSPRIRDGLALPSRRDSVLRRRNVCWILVWVTLGFSQWPAPTVGGDRLCLPRKHTWVRVSCGYYGGTYRLVADAPVLSKSGRYGRYVSLEFRGALLLDF